MKKYLFLFVITLLLTSFLPIQVKASTLSCSQVDGMAIFGYDYNEWKFIGAIANEYNSDSIANEYGAGSEYKSDSIFNDYGSFGSEYSSYSAFNDYASKPPIIVNDSYKFVGYLTTSDYKFPSINTYEAVACAKNSYSSPNSKMEDVVFKSIPSSGSSGYSGGYVPTPSTEQYTCPANSSPSLTDLTKCSCNSGYQINPSKDACVVVPVKSNEQLCKEQFGSNAMESINRGSCICESGYKWNETQTSCVYDIKSLLLPGCSSTSGYSATTGLMCDGSYRCASGSVLNSGSTACISTAPVKNSTNETAKTSKTEKPKSPTIKTEPKFVKGEIKDVVEAVQKTEVENEKNIVTEQEDAKAPEKTSWFKRLWNWFRGK